MWHLPRQTNASGSEVQTYVLRVLRRGLDQQERRVPHVQAVSQTLLLLHDGGWDGGGSIPKTRVLNDAIRLHSPANAWSSLIGGQTKFY